MIAYIGMINTRLQPQVDASKNVGNSMLVRGNSNTTHSYIKNITINGVCANSVHELTLDIGEIENVTSDPFDENDKYCQYKGMVMTFFFLRKILFHN